MSEVIFNIYGGTQQVNPNATTAIQNFYGDQFAAEKLKEEALQELQLSAEAEALSLYINKVEEMPRYLSLLSACTTATELAKAVMTLLEDNPKLTKEEVVKERFIEKLLPLAPKLTQGNTISNLRARINDELARRPRKRT